MFEGFVPGFLGVRSGAEGQRQRLEDMISQQRTQDQAYQIEQIRILEGRRVGSFLPRTVSDGATEPNPEPAPVQEAGRSEEAPEAVIPDGCLSPRRAPKIEP